MEMKSSFIDVLQSISQIVAMMLPPRYVKFLRGDSSNPLNNNIVSTYIMYIFIMWKIASFNC